MSSSCDQPKNPTILYSVLSSWIINNRLVPSANHHCPFMCFIPNVTQWSWSMKWTIQLQIKQWHYPSQFAAVDHLVYVHYRNSWCWPLFIMGMWLHNSDSRFLKQVGAQGNIGAAGAYSGQGWFISVETLCHLYL